MAVARGHRPTVDLRRFNGIHLKPVIHVVRWHLSSQLERNGQVGQLAWALVRKVSLAQTMALGKPAIIKPGPARWILCVEAWFYPFKK
jgi:hypothetical protein